MKKNIWLTRHGETDFNVRKIIQGSSNSELTPVGLEQIEALARFFESIKLDAIYSSDLKRALITAEQISLRKNLNVYTSALLRERSFGIYEGKEFASYLEEVGEAHHDISFRPTQAESLQDVCDRAGFFISQIINSEAEDILIVAHGAFNRCFLAAAMNKPEFVYQIKQGNCCVNKLLHAKDSGFEVVILNSDQHLPQLKP